MKIEARLHSVSILVIGMFFPRVVWTLSVQFFSCGARQKKLSIGVNIRVRTVIFVTNLFMWEAGSLNGEFLYQIGW